MFGILGSGVVAEWLFGAAREEVTRSRSIALLVAEQRSGLRREDIAERIAEDPRLVPLLTRLLYAAGMTKHEQTLRAMGAAFGQAVGERDSLDECELILTALADLTANHAATLLLLSTDSPELAGGPNAWTPDHLVRSSELPARATTLCLAALVARGLAETPTGFGGLAPAQSPSLAVRCSKSSGRTPRPHRIAHGRDEAPSPSRRREAFLVYTACHVGIPAGAAAAPLVTMRA